MIFFLLIVSLLIIENSLAQYEGDECSTNKFQGVCTILEKCPSMYQQLVMGNPPDMLCSFSGFDPVVCCPRNIIPSSPSFSTTKETTIRVTEKPLTNHLPGQVAAEKCAEYANSVFTLVTPPILTLNPKPINTSVCGIEPSRRLIIGGTKSGPKQFPHMAAVGYDAGRQGILWLCGGTLISEQFVLTAAHCLYSSEWGSASWVRLGDLNLKRNDDDARPKNIRVIERIKNPDYRSSLLYHDIALLKLGETVQFNAWIRPACLSITKSNPDKALATGWGRVDWTDDEGSEDLLQVTLAIVSQTRCNNFYKDDNYRLNRGIVSDWQICAGEEGKDTCQGDSGGPLIVYNKERDCMYDVIGVTSLGKICGSIVPGVYTRVSQYISWIESIVWP